MIACIDIIGEYLRTGGFDGLYSEHEGCSCVKGDLVPCGEDFSGCRPGYICRPPDSLDTNDDFYICASRDAKPWEN
jgi:hypothetical protein